jgi:hypothetical protein
MTKLQTRYVSCLLLSALPCLVSGTNVQLTIEPITNVLLVTEASDRFPDPPRGVALTCTFPHPDTGSPTIITGNNIVHLADDASQEAQAWAKTNSFRVDFFACIKNTSTNTLNFYDEWNSWGFYGLKIVCYGSREIWITKQPGVWYRNFPSWSSLRPGGVLRIPVAFEDGLWDGATKAACSRGIDSIRIFYDQFGIPTKRNDNSGEFWQGNEFSPFYEIGTVLPRRGFKAVKHSIKGDRDRDAPCKAPLPHP